MNTEKFTKKSAQIIDNAVILASKLGHTYVGSEHLLLSIVNDETNDAAKILIRNKVTYSKLRNEIVQLIGQGTPSILNNHFFTSATKKILEQSYVIASKEHRKQILPEHLLISIISDNSCSAFIVLKNTNADIKKICSELNYSDYSFTIDETIKASRPKESDYPNLFRYGRILTDNSKAYKRDSLIGRNNEVQRVLQILARRNKNNPCLIGEAGVGKTAIVEGIADLFMNNNVPDSLKHKHIFALDLTSMLSGAKYRGDFEERIKLCLDEAVNAENIILFIDEIHTIVGAGAAEGAIDAANIMKPQLARGEVQIIGATTIDEYRTSIEKDKALERRFQPVIIEEPSQESAVEIINGIKNDYEKFHGVTIDEKAVKYAVKLSSIYITERFLPDKAIDVIDEACSSAKMNKFRNPCIVNQNDVLTVISSKTGIPISKITSNEADRLRNLENELSKRITGHKNAVEQISNAVRRSRSGLCNSKRPVASFLFTGPTGTGKTELAKALAECVYGSESSMIRLDMSEYMEKHSVSKIIGAPPGYCGYNDGNRTLCEKVKRQPYSLILLDEIEKADNDVLNILLQLLDEGIITDSSMNKTNFRNCIIIMTSNVGANELISKTSIGFSESNRNSHQNLIREMICERFSPEFINRIDEIIVFNKLNQSELIEIGRNIINSLKKRAESIGINLEFTENIIKTVSLSEDTEKYGARPIRRKVTELIENKLSNMIINSEIKEGDNLKIDIIDEVVTISKCITV